MCCNHVIVKDSVDTNSLTDQEFFDKFFPTTSKVYIGTNVKYVRHDVTDPDSFSK